VRRRQQAGREHRTSVELGRDDRVAVECVGDRLAHARVPERRIGVVEQHVRQQHRAPGLDLDARPLRDIVDEVGAHRVLHEIGRATDEHQDARRRIAHDLHLDVSDRRRRPVARICIEQHVLRRQLAEHERSRTDERRLAHARCHAVKR
jgi:hypothetical protein